jgi:periplasmic glucans biosynthesis protein
MRPGGDPRRGHRRGLGAVALGVWLAMLPGASPSAAAPAPFGFDDVTAIARGLAENPFHAQEDRIPEFLHRLGYDQYRDIRFKRQRALWSDAGLPFQAEFFFPAYNFSQSVAVNVIDAHGTRPVPFSPDLFTYGNVRFPAPVPSALGFAGFRLRYPIHTPSTADEFAVFLGASYFRALAKGEGYGLSARGLAINTAEPSGEEFPSFTQFWLQTPTRTADAITLYALLDGPSATGAYRFVLRPGAPTSMDVTTAIFLREPVAVLGIAPLSSMFLHGKNTARTPGDFRPEVHDSDGLLIASRTGEWTWRPLVNPSGVMVASFSMENPAGFGLMQRDRDFDHYQDLEARYEIRPSAWIVPHGDWGLGDVRLIQLPSQDEFYDNIVAMWVPSHLPHALRPLRLAYEIQWGSEDRRLPPPPGGRAVATRIGAAHPNDIPPGNTVQVFVVDFAGGALNPLTPNAIVEPIVTVGQGGKLLEKHAQWNPVTKGWRASFRLLFTGKDPVELQCFLRHGQDALTETWSYLAQP